MGCVPSGLCLVVLAVAACGSPRASPLADAGDVADAGIAVDAAGAVDAATSDGALSNLRLELLAGDINGPGSVDGTGAEARFNGPNGVALDAAGNLYVADTGNNTLRKVTPAGVVTTLAGTAGMDGSADGTGPAARFWDPCGVAVDAAGNLYVADASNNTIRKVTPAGVVTTLAGTAGMGGIADGTGPAARFVAPNDVALDAAGNLYVADMGNSIVRKITPGGVVTTLAGTARMTGGADGTGPDARFFTPAGVALDAAGNLYVADRGNNNVRKITPAGVVTTLAGAAAEIPGSADGTGPAARFASPTGVAVDGDGNVYVADAFNHTLRKVTPAGVVTTLAGAAGIAGSADGTGPAARFNLPINVVLDRAGNVLVVEAGNDLVRKVTPAGAVTTLAGAAGKFGSADGTGPDARFNSPLGVAVDSAGNVHVADTFNETLRKVTPAGVVTTLAGTGGMIGSADGTGPDARFFHPTGVALDGTGTLYVADQFNSTIRKVTADGVVTTLAGMAFRRGGADGTGPDARFHDPSGVAVDSAGNVYVADEINATIRKITTDGVVTTLAGTARMPGIADGVGASARFNGPRGVAVDGAGNVYVADTFNDMIRKVTADGVVTTLAGAAKIPGSADGTGANARFNHPTGVAIDSAGNLYVADVLNATIRKITPAGITTTVAGNAGKARIVLGALPRFGFPEYLAIVGDSLVISDTNAVLLLRHGAE